MPSSAESFLGLTPELWQALGLTLRLAALSTALLLLLSIPIAWVLARAQGVWASIFEAVVSLPIVLPPTVLGFYLLILFAPDQPLGRQWVRLTGDTLTFSFSGLVAGSVIYSLPYALQPILQAFRAIAPAQMDAAYNLGATPWAAFRWVALPSAYRGIQVGAVLSFAHTLGEYGVVVMIGGSIPGKTRVASIALYDEVQKLNYPAAHRFAAVLLIIAFAVVWTANRLQNRGQQGSR